MTNYTDWNQLNAIGNDHKLFDGKEVEMLLENNSVAKGVVKIYEDGEVAFLLPKTRREARLKAWR